MFWKNPAVLNGKKNTCTSKEKKSTKFIFKQILDTVFGAFLKIDTRSNGLDKCSSSVTIGFWLAENTKETTKNQSD